MDQKPTKKIDLKKEQVANLVEKIAKSKSIAFVDYHGLGAKAIGELRTKIKEAGGELNVTKNTLLSRALQSTHYPLPTSPAKRGEPTTHYPLSDPTAAVFAFEDEIAPIKAIADLAKSLGFPKFKFGFFGKTAITAAGLEEISQIPGREALQAKVVGALSSPIYGIVSVLSANLRNMVFALDQIRTQKEEAQSS